MEPSNVLRIESLNEEWRDKDVIILHACFQLLKDFVEKEIIEQIDWGHDEETKRAKAEIDFLYDWWLKRAEFESELEEKQYCEDNLMLKRLIDIRQYLWS